MPPAEPQVVTLASGIPLHIRVTKTAPVRIGAPVAGTLTEDIYVKDRLILPKGTAISGIVRSFTPTDRTVRTQALLNGDVTPLHDPVVDFTTAHLASTNTDIALHSTALIRDTKVVRFVSAGKRPSLFEQGKTMVKQRIDDTRETVFGPNKKDRAVRLLYSQLPYHPQRIWVGTQFLADLTAPATVSLPAQAPIMPAESPSLSGLIVSARLANNLTSKAAKKGDTVTAIVTAPLFDTSHNLVLAEGTELDGTVLQSKAARSFGRNGALHFAFRSVKRDGEEQAQKVYGTLTGTEGSAAANVTVDSEGNVQANADKNRFVAPLLLALTAVAGHDLDGDHHGGGGGGIGLGHTTVASNGFGLVARIVAMSASNANVATGFGAYAFAKSIYFRFLTRGHEVAFPKDTEVEVQLSTRESMAP